MSGPESQTLIAAAPGGTEMLADRLRLSPFLNENGRLSRIWSLTATMTCPSGIGASNASRSVAVFEATAGAGAAGPVGAAVAAAFAAGSGAVAAGFLACAAPSLVFAPF